MILRTTKKQKKVTIKAEFLAYTGSYVHYFQDRFIPRVEVCVNVKYEWIVYDEF